MQYKELKDKNASPKKYKKWTDDDEAYLDSLKNENITINETELGRERAELKKKKERELALLARETNNPQHLHDIIEAAVSSLATATNLDLDATVEVVAPWEV